MARGIARSCDFCIGTCYNVLVHGVPLNSIGIIITSSGNSCSNSMGQARLGDTVLWCCCGATSIIVASSPTNFSNSMPKAVTGDIVVGMGYGNIVTMSGDHYTI